MKLTKFENLARQLIETPFKRLFRTGIHPADLANALTTAIDNQHRIEADGRCLAPDDFVIRISPADLAQLHQQPDWSAEQLGLERHLQNLLLESDCHLHANLHLSVQADPTVAVGDINVQATISAPR